MKEGGFQHIPFKDEKEIRKRALFFLKGGDPHLHYLWHKRDLGVIIIIIYLTTTHTQISTLRRLFLPGVVVTSAVTWPSSDDGYPHVFLSPSWVKMDTLLCAVITPTLVDIQKNKDGQKSRSLMLWGRHTHTRCNGYSSWARRWPQFLRVTENKNTQLILRCCNSLVVGNPTGDFSSRHSDTS